MAIDEQMRGRDPFAILQAVSQAVHVPVGVAGGINSETAAAAVAHGAAYVIVGGAITKALDPAAATQEIRRALDEGAVIPTTLFKRGGAEEIHRVLEMVSAANLSDALHRGGVLEGLRPLAPGMRLVGPALTVRTYPGDWAKPVEAIDLAQPGAVLVIDAGGVGPAIWGELATHSAIQRGLAGVVIDGAIRDSGDIVKLGFPGLFPPGDAQRRGTQGFWGDRRPHPHRQPESGNRGLAPGGRRRGDGPAQKSRWNTPTGPWTSWKKKTASGRRSRRAGRWPR